MWLGAHGLWYMCGGQRATSGTGPHMSPCLWQGLSFVVHWIHQADCPLSFQILLSCCNCRCTRLSLGFYVGSGNEILVPQTYMASILSRAIASINYPPTPLKRLYSVNMSTWDQGPVETRKGYPISWCGVSGSCEWPDMDTEYQTQAFWKSRAISSGMWDCLIIWFFVLCVCVCFVFRDRFSLCSPGCPGTHFVDQVGLELRNLPASGSRVLGLKACATTPGLSFFLTFFLVGGGAYFVSSQLLSALEWSSLSMPSYYHLFQSPQVPGKAANLDN